MKKYHGNALVVKSFKFHTPQITYLIKKKLWAQVLVALFLGLVFGVFLGPEVGIVEKGTAEIITDWLSIPANLFLKIIQMIIIPLIFASIIRGITSAGSLEQLQKLGLGAAMYFVVTTIIALTIGILLVSVITPGNLIDSSLIRESFGIEDIEPVESAEFSIQDIPQSIVGVIPSNPLASFMSGEMLSIIVFALIVGVSMISLPKQSSQPILDLLESIQKITLKVVSWAMRLVPFAAFWSNSWNNIQDWSFCNDSAWSIHVNCSNWSFCNDTSICHNYQIFYKETTIIHIYNDERCTTPCVLNFKFCCCNAIVYQNCRGENECETQGISIHHSFGSNNQHGWNSPIPDNSCIFSCPTFQY